MKMSFKGFLVHDFSRNSFSSASCDLNHVGLYEERSVRIYRFVEGRWERYQLIFSWRPFCRASLKA